MSTRRDVLEAIVTSGVAASLPPLRFVEAEPTFPRMKAEGKDTPKICLGFYGPVDEASMRRLKQIGVDHVLTGGPRIPWSEADVRARIEQLKAGGCRGTCRPGTAWAPTPAPSSSGAQSAS